MAEDVEESRIERAPLSMTLEEVHGSVEPLNRPEDFESIAKIIREEREERWLKKDS
jgi:hypothetical protein